MTDDSAGDSGVRDDSRPVVYDLAPDCTDVDVSLGEHYHAVVNGVVDYGVFVDISDNVSGLIHESNLDRSYDVGDRLVVTLAAEKDNGDLAFDTPEFDQYRTELREHEPDITPIDALATGETATIEGRLVQIKQTGGPTIFEVTDGTGIVSGAAFEEAGVRAYPDAAIDDVVRITGTVELHDDVRQIEIDSLRILADETAAAANDSIDATLSERATPADIDPLVEWPAFEPIFDDLVDLAERLRATVLAGRPIRIRHHADGDGMCGATPLQLALENFITEVHADPDAPEHLCKRLPSKAPYYEM